MINQGPYTLTSNVSLTLSDPYASTGSYAATIQIQNQSGFLLTITGIANPTIVQSFTAQTITLPSGGGSVTITPSSTVSGGSTNSLVVVWMLSGETTTLPDGQLTAAAVAAAISGTVQTESSDVTIVNTSVSVNSSTTSTNFNYSTNTSPETHAILVEVDQVGSSGSWAGASAAYSRVQVFASNAAVLQPSLPPDGPILADTGFVPYNTTFPDVVPVMIGVVLPNSQIVNSINVAITSYTPGGPTSTTYNVRIMGFTQAIPQSVFNYPIYNGLYNLLQKNSDGSIGYVQPFLQSSAYKISVGDSLAPADGGGIVIINAGSSSFNTVFTSVGSSILRSFMITTNGSSTPGRVGLSNPQGGRYNYASTPSELNAFPELCPPGGLFVPANTGVQFYVDTGQTYIVSYSFTTL